MRDGWDARSRVGGVPRDHVMGDETWWWRDRSTILEQMQAEHRRAQVLRQAARQARERAYAARRRSGLLRAERQPEEA